MDTGADIIVDVEATPTSIAQEVASTKVMIERVKERFELPTKKLIGDTAYGTAEFLEWMVNEQNIEPHVPVWEKAERDDGTFSRSDFEFDETDNSYTCPNGKKLYARRRKFKKKRSIVTKAGYIIYRASKRDCTGCPLKQRCCPNTQTRKVPRHIYEAARAVARAVAERPDYRITRRQRKKVEIVFGHMKRILKVDRLRLRGISGARDEFLLTATAQNLRRMAKILGTGPPEICPAT